MLYFAHDRTPDETPTQLILRGLQSVQLQARDVVVQEVSGGAIAGRYARWFNWALRDDAPFTMVTASNHDVDVAGAPLHAAQGILALPGGFATWYLEIAGAGAFNAVAARTSIQDASTREAMSPRGACDPFPEQILSLQERLIALLPSATGARLYATPTWLQLEARYGSTILVEPTDDGGLRITCTPEANVRRTDSGPDGDTATLNQIAEETIEQDLGPIFAELGLVRTKATVWQDAPPSDDGYAIQEWARTLHSVDDAAAVVDRLDRENLIIWHEIG